MKNWSQESIQEALDYWGPKYAEKGVQLTEEDAREILDNLTGFFELLYEIDRKHRLEHKFNFDI